MARPDPKTFFFMQSLLGPTGVGRQQYNHPCDSTALLYTSSYFSKASVHRAACVLGLASGTAMPQEAVSGIVCQHVCTFGTSSPQVILSNVIKIYDEDVWVGQKMRTTDICLDPLSSPPADLFGAAEGLF